MFKRLFIASVVLNLALVACCGLLGWQLQKQERQLVKKYEPGFVQIYEEFAMEPPRNPQTVEELVEPLHELVKNLSR